MCTSFIYRGEDTLIAMNYDNYGNNLQVAPYNPSLFLVRAKLGGENLPLFGIRSDGVFVNQQFITRCDGSGFRYGEGVITTIEFVEKVLFDKLEMNNMEEFLNKYKIVSPPDFMFQVALSKVPKFHLHTMLVDVNGDCYIIEPARGNLKYTKDKKYIVMSNCSLYEAVNNGYYSGFGKERQEIAEEMLAQADESFQVMDAFEILKAVHLFEYEGFCSTEFSFVYSANENAVYYCYKREFNKVYKYQMEGIRYE